RIGKGYRAAALLLILLLSFGLAGCNQTEKDFYNATTEVMDYKCYTMNGSMKIDLKQVPASATGNMDPFVFNILSKMLSNLSLEYTQKVDYNKNLYQADIFLKESSTKATKLLLSLRLADNILYVQGQGLFDLLPEFGGDLDYWSQTFGESKWVSMTEEDCREALELQDYPGSLFDLNRQAQNNLMIQDLFDRFITDVLTDYQTGCVKKSGNKYVLTLTAADACRVVHSLCVYGLENSDKVDQFLNDALNNLTSEQLQALGMDEDMRAEAVSSLNEAMVDLASNKNDYLTDLEESQADWEEAAAPFQGSKLVYTFEKSGAKTFNDSMVLNLKTNDSESADENLDMTFTVQTATQVKSSVDVAVPPTGQVVSLKELAATRPTCIDIDVDNNYYTLEKGLGTKYGDLEIKIIDDSVYLPLRQVAEALDEKVVWDQQTGNIYIEKDSQQIPMTGIIEDGATFVKARDFEKLGYEVYWNEYLRTVTIQTPAE
ncbi:MAG TPA: copper amine oxidase N-terminal domain-containing protein, partial [Syntrophomonas sp.]|nr:copper amine oxidase N-terminal domain-containing protein [Syntrophomonas sp.]